MAIGQANVPIGRRTLAPVNARRKPWRSQLRVLAGLLCLTAAVAGISQLHASPAPHPRLHSSTVVPSALVPQLSASIGASQRSYWPVRDGDSFRARGAGIQSSFSPSGVELGVGHGTLGLRVAGLGRGQRTETIPAVAPVSLSN